MSNKFTYIVLFVIALAVSLSYFPLSKAASVEITTGNAQTNETPECIVTDLKGDVSDTGTKPVQGTVENVSSDESCPTTAYLHIFGTDVEPHTVVENSPEESWLTSQKHVLTQAVTAAMGTTDDFSVNFDDSQYCWYQADLTRTDEVRLYPEYPDGPQYNGDFMIDYTILKGTKEDCGDQPTPTPTVTPKPTSTPTATPTPHDNNDDPRCTGLSASPDDGTAPLTVRFNASGFDPNGPIKEYEFDFGDASDGQPQIWKQDDSEATHRYQYEGDYIATVRVKDQGGQWRGGNSECRVEILVDNKPRVLGSSTTTELPKTGASALAGAGLLALGTAGRFLRRRFKIV